MSRADDLRDAADAARATAAPLDKGGTYDLELADRLEAWADVAPLEAAVLDAAKAWFAGEVGPGLYDAVRALREATDA